MAPPIPPARRRASLVPEDGATPFAERERENTEERDRDAIPGNNSASPFDQVIALMSKQLDGASTERQAQTLAITAALDKQTLATTTALATQTNALRQGFREQTATVVKLQLGTLAILCVVFLGLLSIAGAVIWFKGTTDADGTTHVEFSTNGGHDPSPPPKTIPVAVPVRYEADDTDGMARPTP